MNKVKTNETKEELLGKPFCDLINPKHRGASLDKHRRKIKGDHFSYTFTNYDVFKYYDLNSFNCVPEPSNVGKVIVE